MFFRIELFSLEAIAPAGYDTTCQRFRFPPANDQAGRVSRALCRTRVVAEMHQRRGTQIAEHLKLVLSIIDRQQER